MKIQVLSAKDVTLKSGKPARVAVCMLPSGSPVRLWDFAPGDPYRPGDWVEISINSSKDLTPRVTIKGKA